MNESLQEVISAAVEGATAKVNQTSNSGRPVPLLRAVQKTQLAAPRPAMPMPPPGATPSGADPAVLGDGPQLGRSGLRLAFWLCGFHETLLDRQRRGETLNQREASLLALSSKDFATIRPEVVGMAIEHLQNVLSRTDQHGGSGRGSAPGTMEAFALETLISLSARASDLLRDGSPDIALSLFGGGPSIQEPLAIFQLIFSTAVGLAESFARLIPEESETLEILIEALGSEVERI